MGIWDVAGISLLLCLCVVRAVLSRFSFAPLIGLYHLPATLLHEASHAVVGVIFGASPTGFNLVPRRRCVTDEAGGTALAYELGSVSFRNINALNAFPVALAPLLLLVAAYVLLSVWHHPVLETPPIAVCKYLLLYFLASASIPSTTDLSVAFKARYAVVTVSYILFMAMFAKQIQQIISFFVGVAKFILDAFWS